MLVILVFLVFLLLLIGVTRKKYSKSFGRGLLLLLTVSFACSLFLSFSIPEYNNVRFIPTLYMVSVYLIWIFPFLGAKVTPGVVANAGRFELLFSIFIIVIVLPSTLYYMGSVVNVFSGDSSSMLDVRMEVNNADVDTDRGFSITNLFIAGAQFYVMPLYLFFLSLARCWKKFLSALLLLSSFSFPLYCLSRFGRDGIVYWVVNALILYECFKNSYDKKTRKILFTSILVLLTVVVAFIMTISLVRFSSSYGLDSLIEGTIGYIGQSVKNFSRFWGAETDYSPSMFPGLLNLLGLRVGTYSDILSRNNLYSLTNAFSSFVTPQILSYGYFGAIVFSLIVGYLVYRIKKITYSKNSSFGLMALLVVMQVPMNGVFYYRQGIGNGDVYLLLSIAMLLLFPKICRLFLK